MKKQSMIIASLFIILCLSFVNLNALKTNRFKSEEEANHYLIKHYNIGCKHYNCQEWRSAANEFEKVIYFFPCSDAAAEAAYYLAVCYFEMKEFDFANKEFSNYLKTSQHPLFFEDAFYYKFCIAEHFKAGKKKRPFELRYLPKWVSAQDLALTIYDEIIAALPHHELTLKALYSKADLLKCMREYRDCIETYQIIIRRFPKNEIVPICYVNIANTYYEQSRFEFQNPDILALAELNLRKFKEDFPRDERIKCAEDSISRIKESYAKGLCDLGLFYEHMKQPDAAAIYFQSSIEEFPETKVAKFCRSRLVCLGYANYEESISSEEPSVYEECFEVKSNPCINTTTTIDEQTQLQNSHDWMEALPNVEEIPSQECYHYSLMKKKQSTHTSYLPVNEEEDLTTCSMEGNMPQSMINDPKFQEDAPYILHYSQLKHRDQYGNPQ